MNRILLTAVLGTFLAVLAILFFGEKFTEPTASNDPAEIEAEDIAKVQVDEAAGPSELPSSHERTEVIGPAADSHGDRISTLKENQLRLILEFEDVAKGEPAQGVEIAIRDIGSHWPWPEVWKGEVEDDGRADIILDAPANYSVSANRGQDFVSVRENLGLLSPGEHVVKIRMHPMPWLGYAVRVVDGNGTPVAGVRVRSHEKEAFEPLETDTDGWVRFEFQDRFGPVLLITHADFASTLAVLHYEEREKTVTLQGPGRVSGRVLDVLGQPVEAAVVRIGADWTMAGFWEDVPDFHQDAVTAADGKFSFDHLPPNLGLWMIALKEKETARLLLAPTGVGELRQDIVLAARPVIEGTVVDIAGAPIAGMPMEAELWLRLKRSGSDQVHFAPQMNAKRMQAVTDEQGQFVLHGDGLIPGTWVVGTQGALDRFPVSTDSAGPVLQYLPERQEVEVLPGDTTEPLRFVLHRGLEVRGFVLDPNRQPLQEARVWARAVGQGLQRPYFTDELAEDGSFVLGPVAPGEYQIGATSMTLGFEGQSSEPAVAGGPPVIIVCKAIGFIRVQVIDSSGKGVLARVRGFTTIDGETSMWAPSTDGDGHCSVQLGEASEWTFVAWTDDGRCGVYSDVRLVPGEETEIIIPLEAGAKVSIRQAENESDSAQAQIHFRGVKVWQGNASFLEDMKHFPEGDLRVVLLDDSGKTLSQRTAFLLADTTTEIIFE